MTLYDLVCGECEQEFQATSKRFLFCNPCGKARKAGADRTAKPADDGRAKAEVWQPKPRPVLLSDKEQLEINRAIDRRLFSDCKPAPVKVIRPGDPGFKELEKQVTDIRFVRRGVRIIPEFFNQALV